MIIRQRRPSGGPSSFALILALLAPIAPVAAQEPAPVTLNGVVVDRITGTPVKGAFLSVGERGPRAISDSTGAFRLLAVSSGDHTILVQRIGYVNSSLKVRVSGQMTIRVTMEPQPIQLEGIVGGQRAEVAFSGTVSNARDGTPVPWALLSLSEDVVHDAGRASSDPQGIFRIDDVPTGHYFLRVQALGYVSQYHMVDVTVPPETVRIELQPDSAIQAGLVRLSSDLRSRRNYRPGINFSYGQERLHYSAAPSAKRFLEMETSVIPVGCAGLNTIRDTCMISRGQIMPARVYIDELPIMGGWEVLDTYEPSEFYMIEVFATDRTIRAYTYTFMEQMAKRPRAFIP